MSNRLRASLLALVTVFVVSGAASAQTRSTSADLSGVVYDPSKAVLPGVTVTVTNADTGLVRAAVTSGDGRYAVLALPPGTYHLRVELQGFAPQTREGVQLALGSAVEVGFTLALAGAQTTVAAWNKQKVPAPDKATLQMEWVGYMNNLKHSAEEIVMAELIYN